MKKVNILFVLCIVCFSPLFLKTNSLNAQVQDVSSLDWRLWGYRPNVWRMNFNFEHLEGSWAEYVDIPMELPGSVQAALLKAGLIDDWTIGIDYRNNEWIENRHWLVVTEIPDAWIEDRKGNIEIHCKGLDYKGSLMVNGNEAGRFNNAFIPYTFEISAFLKESNNTLAFVFECPPENLAQIGWTSKISDWKPRFNYGWDWMPRIVQTGIWDDVYLKVANEYDAVLEQVQILTSADKKREIGSLSVRAFPNAAALKGKVKIELSDLNGKKILDESIDALELTSTKKWNDLKVKRWYPNGLGEQPLYNLQLTVVDEKGEVTQQENKRIGFRSLEWLPCEGAAPEADPWICSVNDQPFFIQGVNWTPIRPNFADLKKEDYSRLLLMYKEMGINTIRIWGGGFPEKDWLYDLCDELGILIWQDFPLSSSGLENYPPEGEEEIYSITRIVTHYVSRLHHHASLMIWCAGNELYEIGDTAPVTDKHRMIAAMKDVVIAMDPTRKFVPGSPSGPSIYANYNTFGKGINWDVHGPWNLPFTEHDNTMNAVRKYWEDSDALMHSEAGVPGAMSTEMMRKYKGELALLPANIENPLWRIVNWWIDWSEYLGQGNDPESVDAYVEWSQTRQKEGLSIAVKASKDRFPRCGGFLIWMGHDSFPCPINTSIIDFDGNPKPVVAELAKIFKDNSYLNKDNSYLNRVK